VKKGEAGEMKETTKFAFGFGNRSRKEMVTILYTDIFKLQPE
jgi:hypothetical protein